VVVVVLLPVDHEKLENVVATMPCPQAGEGLAAMRAFPIAHATLPLRHGRCRERPKKPGENACALHDARHWFGHLESQDGEEKNDPQDDEDMDAEFPEEQRESTADQEERQGDPAVAGRNDEGHQQGPEEAGGCSELVDPRDLPPVLPAPRQEVILPAPRMREFEPQPTQALLALFLIPRVEGVRQ